MAHRKVGHMHAGHAALNLAGNPMRNMRATGLAADAQPAVQREEWMSLTGNELVGEEKVDKRKQKEEEAEKAHKVCHQCA